MADLRYISNQLRGHATFDADPEPTNEVLNFIGLEGIEQIHQQLEEMLKFRKKMFGAFHGFDSTQYFIDMDSKCKVRAEHKVTGDIPYKTTSAFNPVYDEEGKECFVNPILDDHYTLQIHHKEIQYKARWRIEQLIEESTINTLGKAQMEELKHKAYHFKKWGMWGKNKEFWPIVQ